MRRKIFLTGCLLFLCVSLLHAGDAVPVLCFHRFSDDTAAAAGRLTVSFRQFENVLWFLADRNFVSCFPEDVQSDSCASKRRIILTFDDGSRDHLRAAELMEKYGFRGIFFVIPLRVKDGTSRSMTAEELRSLAARGHRIAAHGYRHEMIPESREEAVASCELSPAVLREVLGAGYSPTDFAFPFGHYDTKSAKTLGKTYKYLHTVNPGYWDGKSPVIPRMVVTSDADQEFFTAYITGAPLFHPTLAPVTDDGAVTPVAEFRNEDTTRPVAVELMSVSPDLTGRLYTRHTLDTNIVFDGSRALLNLKNLLRLFYAPDRRIISYALVTESRGTLRFLTTGHTHWIQQPLSTSHQLLTPSRDIYAH